MKNTCYHLPNVLGGEEKVLNTNFKNVNISNNFNKLINKNFWVWQDIKKIMGKNKINNLEILKNTEIELY